MPKQHIMVLIITILVFAGLMALRYIQAQTSLRAVIAAVAYISLILGIGYSNYLKNKL